MSMPSDALPPVPFHPAVRTWFERRFPEGPTPPQARGWPAIAAGHDTLIAAPTGSGKTLAAFLVAIDRAYREVAHFALTPPPVDGEPPSPTRVVYVSPLKALAADIEQNLIAPLEEISEVAEELGLEAPELRVALRSGDTPSSARAAMLKKPPHILITTPESLYLLVTAEKSRAILRDVDTVIVDEIHAVARDKRGSHLALTLERLDALCHGRPARVGLSATQRPIETVARLLVGVGDRRELSSGEPRPEPGDGPRCTIVDEGHRRALDLALELPRSSELEAVASKEQMGEVLDQIAAHVKAHKTTLVFVNTRRLAERLAHDLAERLGESGVAAHHGSLSKDRRLRVEAQLRAGALKALVATASLELGIDIGPVELVCQIGSPRSLATFLQRVGRSGHTRGGTPKGILFPLTRDELVECAALLRGVRAGRLDAIHPFVAPLDIVAQQIVAACAAEDWKEDELFALIRRASPFAELARDDFDAVVEMLSDGIATGRGRRAAYLHRDRVNGELKGRRGARLAALTSGGAIPERADYRVILDPDETFVGTVDEDWAIESMAGDIFLLGSTSWRIRRVEAGVVRVTDAQGLPPTVPFWLGEAPARTEELSSEVSALRAEVGLRLAADDASGAAAWLASECGLGDVAAGEIVRYLAAARTALGALPTREEVIFERFFDETGGMQLVVHAPFGGRTNRALGLSLRKRFCRQFDFELQAAASDDAVVLSLGPQHSFPLAHVTRYLSANDADAVLSQAVLASPMFAARWRWNLNRSLAVLRMRAGKRNPPPIQRMEAEDLMAAIFPGLAACQDNMTGPIEIPDHPLVSQTLHDCLHEAMDVDALTQLVRDIESGRVKTRFVETTEPSPLSHEILSARPYTFLDDAPLEERRTRAVTLRRGLPVEARELGRLSPEAIARVREESEPDPRDADELHDLLLTLGVVRPHEPWSEYFEALVAQGRACAVESERGPFWCAIERRRAVEILFPEAIFRPDRPLPPVLAELPEPDLERAALEIVRGHLDCTGPIGLVELAERTRLTPIRVEAALARLEGEGFALRGHFETPEDARGVPREQFCSRRLLTRIHRYTQERLRAEIQPVSAQDFMRFLLRWQHVAPGTLREGRRGVLSVVEQLQGFELALGAWEEAILPARVDPYRSTWLDALSLSGEVVWGRLSPRAAENGVEASQGRGGSAPSRATPVSFLVRADLDWMLRAVRGDQSPALPGPGAARDVFEMLRARGALFHSDLVAALRRLPVEVEEGLWDLVSRGLVSADGFQAVRTLLGSRDRWSRRPARSRMRQGLRRGARAAASAEGRWSLFPAALGAALAAGGEEAGGGEDRPDTDPDELAEATAEQLLVRWGVVFRDLLARESLALPWREVLWALRRMEARGVIRGGRFVTGFVGEQFALPGAVDALRRTRRLERKGEIVALSAADPLNLVGILTPGPRVPALRGNRVVYRDGLPVGSDEAGAGAATR